MDATRTCKVESCARTDISGWGWCRKHYMRWYARKRIEDVERTPEHLLRRKLKEAPSGCWEWQGAPMPNGYGRISLGPAGAAVVWYVHRLAWTLWRGPIPDGLLVLHKCDNRPCCNPDHLFLGTHKENTQDMIRKGREGFRYNLPNARASARRKGIIK